MTARMTHVVPRKISVLDALVEHFPLLLSLMAPSVLGDDASSFDSKMISVCNVGIGGVTVSISLLTTSI